MRSFLVSAPPGHAPNNVLVFLHGVGEAFDPSPRLGERKPAGIANVFNHGIPMLLNRPGEYLQTLPLFKDFVTIVPQTCSREDLADRAMVEQLMNSASGIAKAVCEEPQLAVVGFSRGGFAAFNVAERNDVKVIVTMDAAAPGNEKQSLTKAINNTEKPFWMFYTNYEDCDPDWHDRITTLHDHLPVPIAGLTNPPPHDRKCKTLIASSGEKSDRHKRVCDTVSTSRSVYEWIVQQLA